MDTSIVLAKGLCLPQSNLEALIQGRIIAAIPSLSLRPQRDAFALIPQSTNSCSQTISILAWATCEDKEYLDSVASLTAEDNLSYFTAWTQVDLAERLANKGRLFLSYLRVYLLPEPKEISLTNLDNITERQGKFVSLKHQWITVKEIKPVLSQRLFLRRQQQLKNRQLPEHPELEILLQQIQSHPNPAAKQLEQNLNIFLNYNNSNNKHFGDPVTALRLPFDFAQGERSGTAKSKCSAGNQQDWINTIAALGTRSKELDEGKSNYQAGTDFENIVKKSLEFLGYTIEAAHGGGPGGLDIFCSQPYALVIECKAGKKIPNATAVQLLNLATLRLNQALLPQTVKLIIGPGKPTSQLSAAAQVHQMAIINPETLEKLVQLQAKYPHSIDLWQLKSYLQPAPTSNEEVVKYLEMVEEKIRVRSHVVELVRKYLASTNSSTVGIEQLYGAYVASGAPQSLTQEELSEIMIELSSPLTGYLGREGTSFYFLRKLYEPQMNTDERR